MTPCHIMVGGVSHDWIKKLYSSAAWYYPNQHKKKISAKYSSTQRMEKSETPDKKDRTEFKYISKSFENAKIDYDFSGKPVLKYSFMMIITDIQTMKYCCMIVIMYILKQKNILKTLILIECIISHRLRLWKP